MGILNLFDKNPDDHQAIEPGRVKGPCRVLLEHGIDPAGLKFTLNQDGSVTVSGRARDASERDRICQVIAEMPLVEGVTSNMLIEATGSAAEPATETAGESGAGASAAGKKAANAEFAVSDTRQAASHVLKQNG